MDFLQSSDPGIVTHAIAAVGFLLVCVLLISSWRRRGPGIALIVACSFTALWAAAIAAAMSDWPLPTWIPPAAELLRTGSWLAVLIVLRRLLIGPTSFWQICRSTSFVFCVIFLALGLADVIIGPMVLVIVGITLQPGFLAGLGLAIVGLLLLENIFKLTTDESRWAFKHLVIGLGALFGFDLVFYSEALLFKQFNAAAIAARPLIGVAILPLIVVAAARIRRLSFDVSVSRRAALQTTALVGSGVYLVAISGVGYIMRELDIGWGPVLQVTFVCGAAMLLATVLASGAVRARARRLLAENFFTFTFDYRHEWIRFIDTISSPNQSSSLHERAIRAVANVFDCGSGAIYACRSDGALVIAYRWNWGHMAKVAALPLAVVNELKSNHELLVLSPNDKTFASLLEQPDILAWFEEMDDPWFLLALRSREALVGAIILACPRVRRKLTWEDRDLLGILEIQLASYVVEEQATRALVAAQKFEQVAKRFTFIAHDLKNLVSQLTLVLHHAEQYGENPQFLRDAFATVKGSVDKMQRMLVRLREAESSDAPPEPVEIGTAIGDAVGAAQPLRERIVVHAAPFQIWARANHEQLVGIVQNIVQNALEATPSDGLIDIAYMREGSSVFVEIRDNGIGMTRAFIEQHLFAAFVSAKGSGYGVGIYQTRETLERWGGGIEIDSVPGRGTTIRLLLLGADRPQSKIEQGEAPAMSVHGTR
jgi:putative PEP-CTERM system histidine kinase